MRIACMGASGTGKSTITKYISEKYGLPVNPVGSRSVAKEMGFDSPYGVDAAGKRAEFQRRLLTEKSAWEVIHEKFVTDRTTLDNLAYTIIHDAESIDDEQLTLAMVGMNQYDVVLACPMDWFFNPGTDPSRKHDPTYHRVYEAVLDGLLFHCARVSKRVRWKLVRLRNGELGARQRMVDEIMNPDTRE